MSHYSRKTKAIAVTLSFWLVLDSSVLAMQPLNDTQLSDESGAGLAFPFENFRLEMANTSFVELTGDDPNAANTTFKRGDLRYYGLSMTNGSTAGGVDWFGNNCTTGFAGLGCPRSNSAIAHYSDFDNPFVLRVFNYNKYGTGYPATGLQDRTVLEFIGPSNMDAFRWAFYGEVETGRTLAAAVDGYRAPNGNSCQAGSTTALCLLKLQNIILGRPASRLKPVSVFGSNDATNPYNGPVLRLMQYMGTTADSGSNPKSYGIQYESRLSGDYRMSVNASSSDGVRGSIPTFTNEEGLYFKNVQAYLPLGQMHYQALIFDDAQPGSTGTSVSNGNIAIEVTRLPGDVSAYTDFYSFAGGGPGTVNSGYTRTGRPDRYYETHGYVEWGDKFPDSAGGVSTVRYAGVDPDGPTRTFSAGQGFDNSYLLSGRPSYVASDSPTPANCSPLVCTFNYTGATVGNAVSANTRSEVVSAGGMVFVSKDSSTTWQVLNNQNQAQNNTLRMLWVNNTSSNGAGSNWANTYRLEVDSRYAGDKATYNPMLNVNAINLGHSRVSGLLIQRMRIETLGGQ